MAGISSQETVFLRCGYILEVIGNPGGRSCVVFHFLPPRNGGVGDRVHRGSKSTPPNKNKGAKMRKPGTRKFVYDKETKTIKEVRFNRFKRFMYWVVCQFEAVLTIRKRRKRWPEQQSKERQALEISRLLG